MQDERLENLLRESDADLDAPRGSAGLAERVRATAKKRAARRRYIGAVGIVILVVSVTSAVFERTKKPAVLVDVTSARIEIAQLADEAKWRSELAERLWQRERDAKKFQAQKRRATNLINVPIEAPVERPAYAMLYQADRMARNPGLRDAAIEAYREVSSDFPKTPSAQVARQRLETMIERKDG